MERGVATKGSAGVRPPRDAEAVLYPRSTPGEAWCGTRHPDPPLVYNARRNRTP